MHSSSLLCIFIIRITILLGSQLKNQEIYASLSIQHQNLTFRFLSDRLVDCDKHGNCVRKDKISLNIGIAAKLPHEDQSKGLNQASKEIVSIDPIKGSNNPNFIKGSNSYVCADGVNECFDSCCNKGFCSDPSNICTSALKGSSAIIYSTCIAFFLLVCFYWIMFGCIGVRYSKRRARILLKQEILNNSDNPASQIKSNAFNTLEDFDDGFNNRPVSGIILGENHPHKPIQAKLNDRELEVNHDEDNQVIKRIDSFDDMSVKEL